MSRNNFAAWDLGDSTTAEASNTSITMALSAAMQAYPYVVIDNNSDNYLGYEWASTGNPDVPTSPLVATPDVLANPVIPPNTSVRIPRAGANLRVRTDTGTAKVAVIACRDRSTY